MTNFALNFSHPWLLLLLIPAIALTLIPYFRLNKRYRKNRNRITSIVLHLLGMLLAITTLAGITFSYDLPNENNEIILVVDVSDTQEREAENRDNFVQTVLSYGKYDNYKIGIVTFGFDQKYAVPLTYDVKDIFQKYMEAERPDTSATNIAAALSYAKTLFTHPETGKIVLVTDGKETDEEASLVVKSIAALGIKIDTAFIPTTDVTPDVQLVSVTLPDYHVGIDQECTISVTLKSKTPSSIQLSLSDNGSVNAENGTKTPDVTAGVQTINFKHTFKSAGLHELSFNMQMAGDGVEENNLYNAYYYLDNFNKVLILETKEGESAALEEILKKDDKFDVTVINLYNDTVPDSVDKLRAYDQIILNNVSNADINADLDHSNENVVRGFDKMLYSYTNDYGGGLLTVGGNKEDGTINAYSRSDMYNTLYQRILPVQAINYTPPVGVICIVDSSGSMASDGGDGVTKYDWAKQGMASCLQALTERDYFGIMTLDTYYSTVLPLTPRSEESKIMKAITEDMPDADGGTVFPGAIWNAGQQLRALEKVDRKHIIIITDGEVPEDQRETYEENIKNFQENDGITVTVVVIGMSADPAYGPNPENTPIENLDRPDLTPYERMLRAVILGKGRLYAMENALTLQRVMREELNLDPIKEVNFENFYPTVNNDLSPVVKGLERGEGEDRYKLTVQLGGFYGVKNRATSDLILKGEYDVPIYSQWKFGKAMVGSFMCTLNGDAWSSGFISDPNGQKFILNVVANLMPTTNIRPNEINVRLREYNYLNQLSIFTSFAEGEYLDGKIESVTNESAEVVSLAIVTDLSNSPKVYTTLAISKSNNYSRSDFVIKESGVYKITLTKYNQDGAVLATYQQYKSFSYSAEYDNFPEKQQEEIQANVKNLSLKAKGSMIEDLEDPYEVFKDFEPTIHKVIDPRVVFVILSMIMFLLDIAVRKFKWKWLHEIIRERKENKEKNK